MGALKAIVLFLLGIIFVFFAFPIAFFVSAGLGYILCLLGIGIGAYMIAKREKKALPLVLGVLLVIAGLGSLLVTATVHAGTYAISEAVKTRNLTAKINEPIKAGDWEITVKEVKETAYIRVDSDYYGAKEGQKIVLLRISVKNTGKETQTNPFWFRFPVLISNANKSYEFKSTATIYLNYIPSYKLNESIKSSAVLYREFSITASVAPGTYIEGDFLFQIPKEESPDRLVLKVEALGGYEVTVKLRG
jgi:energy-coupling factor transporter transmembrane protein EcfT